jgi:hypothetical protein
MSRRLQDALVHGDLGKARGLSRHAASKRRNGSDTEVVQRGARRGAGWLEFVSLCHYLNT